MISLEWVSDYIDISDQDLKELAVKITQSGINVEKVITNHIDNLVIGKVISCVDHLIVIIYMYVWLMLEKVKLSK